MVVFREAEYDEMDDLDDLGIDTSKFLLYPSAADDLYSPVLQVAEEVTTAHNLAMDPAVRLMSVFHCPFANDSLTNILKSCSIDTALANGAVSSIRLVSKSA